MDAGKILKFPKRKTLRRRGQLFLTSAEQSLRMGSFKSYFKAGMVLGFFGSLVWVLILLLAGMSKITDYVKLILDL